MVNEVLEGNKFDRGMDGDFQKFIHGFVLDNTIHMEPLRRGYEQVVSDRDEQREQYRRLHRGHGRRPRFAFPLALLLLPSFVDWTAAKVRRDTEAGIIVD